MEKETSKSGAENCGRFVAVVRCNAYFLGFFFFTDGFELVGAGYLQRASAHVAWPFVIFVSALPTALPEYSLPLVSRCFISVRVPLLTVLLLRGSTDAYKHRL